MALCAPAPRALSTTPWSPKIAHPGATKMPTRASCKQTVPSRLRPPPPPTGFARSGPGPPSAPALFSTRWLPPAMAGFLGRAAKPSCFPPRILRRATQEGHCTTTSRVWEDFHSFIHSLIIFDPPSPSSLLAKFLVREDEKRGEQRHHVAASDETRHHHHHPPLVGQGRHEGLRQHGAETRQLCLCRAGSDGMGTRPPPRPAAAAG